MRRYDIVSGILLILSIIDFTLAVPVLVQEKPQECVDVVHIPKDVITVLGERWEEDLEKLGEEYLKTGGKSVESSYSTLSSRSGLGPDHGSTIVVQPPAPNPASSTVNPDPLMEPPSSSSSAFSKQGLWARGSYFPQWINDLWSYLRGDDLYKPLHALTSHPSADPNFDWDYWRNVEDRPASPNEFGQAHNYLVDPLNPPSTSDHAPSPPEPEHKVVTPSPSSNLGSPKEPGDEVVPVPPPSPDPELHLDHQSLGADSQPVDLQSAIYAAKGKVKESRRISGTARDVGNAAQRDSEGVATC